MPTRQSRAAGTRAPGAPKVPSFSEKELTPLGGGRVGRPPNLPELVLFGTGRLMLNVAAVGLLSPKKPVRAIRLYLAEKDSHRYLVIQPAPDSAADAIHIYPSGRHYKRRWPAVVLAWANVALRKVGLVERARFVGIHDQKRNWLVFDLGRPRAFRDEEGPDPMREAIDVWLQSAKRKRTIDLREALKEIQDAWVRSAATHHPPRGPFPFDRPTRLGAYIRKYAARYAQMGVKLAGAGTRPPIVLD
jgi:hypothetical protein